MSSSIERERVIEEIRRLPENRLDEIYSLLHFFRIGLETSRDKIKPIMQFAGAWSEMSEDTFADFMRSITTRRQEASAGRRIRETNID
ncbi:MAG: hypothetical protein HY741_00400 [Chloroflexi bacterium]|nr:hypothetical protein [Chloroflexota bacterium]